MIEGLQYYSPKKHAFSGGLIDDKGLHLAPDHFCSYCRNIRIVNNSFTVRNGYIKVFDDKIGEKLWDDTKLWNDTNIWDDGYTIILNKIIDGGDSMYVTGDGVFAKLDTSTNPRGYTILKEGLSKNVNPFRYGRYILLPDGTKTVNVYDTQATNEEQRWLTCTLPAGAKIKSGGVFQQNIWLLGAEDKGNVIYKSRAGKDNTPTEILDFTGNGSDSLVKQSEVSGMASLRGKMYFFTKDTIEVFTTSSTLEVGGLITVYTTPIAGENRLANDKCTVVADDMVFFLTKGNQIKSLEFRQGFTEISVGDITNRPNQSIQNFLDRLDPEQPTAFGYFHKEKKLVFFHLRERGEKFNNITLVYDVNANCFLVDNNKFYSDVAKFNGKYYATSGVNSEIYEDESENSDNGIPIERERRSITYYIGNPNYRKEFREINITGENDALNEINIDVVCDGKSAFSTKIAGINGKPGGTASEPTGTFPIAEDVPKGKIDTFEYTISPGFLRAKGKGIEINFSGKTFGTFTLSTLAIGYRPLQDMEKTDKLK